jgi:general stress protein 26
MSTDAAHILQFLKSQPMATISTVAPGSLQPESALIAFTQTDDLKIVFESFVDTRKWHNLQRNPHVALVIGWDVEEQLTVQYEGTATAVQPDEVEKYTQLFLAKDTPCTETFLRDSRVRLFIVQPTWIRYSDYTEKVPHVTEMHFTRST